MKKILSTFWILLVILHLNAQRKEFSIDTVCFNTQGNDIGVAFVGDQMFVVSTSLPLSDGTILRNEITGEIYSDLYEVKNCDLVPATFISSEYNKLTSVNSSYNDGPLNSNKSGDIIFLTNNAFSPKNKLGIFYSIKTMDNKWSTPKSSPMNSPNFNVTHPFYDENSKILYFASDKNGNYDLYQVNFDKENWINPKEISIVNSSSDDCFPFLIEDQLFFTSNREGGLGGLDLYQLDSNKISNLGEPFNSAFDDLAISWINDSTGYFSSNRNSNGQNDDVFKINVKTIPEPILVVDNKIEEKKEVESVKFKPEKNINFAFDSYAIQEDHKIYLLEIATEMKKDSTLYLIVSGHTDNVGDKSYNLELSKKRANAVKKYLIKNGVNSNRIIAEGYGFSKPIESNNTAEGRALNRRVDFKILEERQ